MQKLVAAAVVVALIVAFAWWAFGGRDVAPDGVVTPGSVAGESFAGAPTAPLTADEVATEAGTGEKGENAENAETRRVVDTAEGRSWVARGRVLRAVNVPYPGARIRAECFAGYRAEGAPIVTDELTTDSAGGFAWALREPETAVVLRFDGAMAHHLGFPETVRAAPGDPPPQDIEFFVCPLDRVVHGRVTGADGEPVAGAWISASRGRIVGCAADGSYRIELISAFRGSSLTGGAPGHVAERKSVADASGDEVQIDFRLARGFRVAGRVLDEGGRPVADAAVTTFFRRGDPVKTGADGRFLVDDLDPARQSHSLYARKDGYVEARQQVASAPPPADLELVLRRGSRVKGRVYDPNGAPVAGAELYIGFSPAAYNRLDAVSGDDGTFEFPAVGDGPQTLVTQRRGLAPDHRVVQVPDSGGEIAVDVHLGPAHAIEGRVVDGDGAPVEGLRVSVRVRQPDAGFGRDHDEYIDVDGRTAADGSFRLVGLPEGKVNLEFYGQAFVRKEERDVDVDRTDVEVVVERTARVAGRVVDGETGAPIPAFRIRFVRPEPAEGERRGGGYAASWGREGHTFEDPAGEWDSRGEQLERGTVWGVEASADGYAPAHDRHVVASMEPDPDDCVLRLWRGATVIGRVLGRGSGLPMAGATVTWFEDEQDLVQARYEPYGLLRAETDADGRFELGGLPPGPTRLAVEMPEKPRHVDGPFDTQSGARVERLILVSDGARIRGRVNDAGAEPGAGARLLLFRRGPGHSEHLETEARADGTYELAGLEPGEYELFGYSVRGAVCTPYTRIVTIAADQDVEVDLEPAGTGSVRGTLTADPVLPERTSVMLMPSGADAAGRRAFRGVVVGGRFDLRGLPAGAFRLIVSASDGRMGSAAVTVVEGVAAEVDVTMRDLRRRR